MGLKMDIDQRLINAFRSRVKGKIPPKGSHDGGVGHWLERQFGIKANGNNQADIYGWELKTGATSKTTFGDWTPRRTIHMKGGQISRTEFLHIFGAPNISKNNRYSWSGKPSPNIKGWNDFGQRLRVDSNNNIIAEYSWSHDKRQDKEQIVPAILRIENLELAFWPADDMAGKVHRKFNQKGWFVCLRDESGAYFEMGFGEPFNFDVFIDGVKTGDIYFDCGMYETNPRPYSQWRANNNVFWHPRIVRRIR